MASSPVGSGVYNQDIQNTIDSWMGQNPNASQEQIQSYFSPLAKQYGVNDIAYGLNSIYANGNEYFYSPRQQQQNSQPQGGGGQASTPSGYPAITSNPEDPLFKHASGLDVADRQASQSRYDQMFNYITGGGGNSGSMSVGGSGAGLDAESRLVDLLDNPDSIRQTGAYNFRVGQGQDALERSLGAKGLLKSGNRLTALTQYGQDMGSQEYDNQFNRLSSLLGTQLNARNQGLSSLASVLGAGALGRGGTDPIWGAYGTATGAQAQRDVAGTNAAANQAIAGINASAQRDAANAQAQSAIQQAQMRQESDLAALTNAQQIAGINTGSAERIAGMNADATGNRTLADLASSNLGLHQAQLAAIAQQRNQAASNAAAALGRSPQTQQQNMNNIHSWNSAPRSAAQVNQDIAARRVLGQWGSL